jgi:catechol 2,3-dioxygenase
MSLPRPPADPPFAITRFSHVVLNVTDLDVSRKFYEEVIGLVVSDADETAVYLRGVEEAAHHCLVLQRAEAPTAECIGFRVASEDALDEAYSTFQAHGLPAEWVQRPYQSRTLRVSDVAGVPIEFCVSMTVMPRLVLDEHLQHGAAAARIDHLQVHVPNIAAWTSFHVGNGFRISEYGTQDGTEDTSLIAVFLARKGDLLDLVGVETLGPRLHHFSLIVHNYATTLMRVCDILSAQGNRDAVEYGPGRHGLAPQHFLYLRDPDGHRVELVSHGYQLLDPELEPIGWSLEDPRAATTWGPHPHPAWRDQASVFAGVTPHTPDAEIVPSWGRS